MSWFRRSASKSGHVAHDVDQPVGFEISTLMRMTFQRVVLRLDGFEVDHGQVAAAFEVT